MAIHSIRENCLWVIYRPCQSEQINQYKSKRFYRNLSGSIKRPPLDKLWTGICFMKPLCWQHISRPFNWIWRCEKLSSKFPNAANGFLHHRRHKINSEENSVALGSNLVVKYVIRKYSVKKSIESFEVWLGKVVFEE